MKVHSTIFIIALTNSIIITFLFGTRFFVFAVLVEIGMHTIYRIAAVAQYTEKARARHAAFQIESRSHQSTALQSFNRASLVCKPLLASDAVVVHLHAVTVHLPHGINCLILVANSVAVVVCAVAHLKIRILAVTLKVDHLSQSDTHSAGVCRPAVGRSTNHKFIVVARHHARQIKLWEVHQTIVQRSDIATNVQLIRRDFKTLARRDGTPAAVRTLVRSHTPVLLRVTHAITVQIRLACATTHTNGVFYARLIKTVVLRVANTVAVRVINAHDSAVHTLGDI